MLNKEKQIFPVWKKKKKKRVHLYKFLKLDSGAPINRIKLVHKSGLKRSLARKKPHEKQAVHARKTNNITQKGILHGGMVRKYNPTLMGTVGGNNAICFSCPEKNYARSCQKSCPEN